MNNNYYNINLVHEISVPRIYLFYMDLLYCICYSLFELLNLISHIVNEYVRYGLIELCLGRWIQKAFDSLSQFRSFHGRCQTSRYRINVLRWTRRCVLVGKQARLYLQVIIVVEFTYAWLLLPQLEQIHIGTMPMNQPIAALWLSVPVWAWASALVSVSAWASMVSSRVGVRGTVRASVSATDGNKWRNASSFCSERDASTTNLQGRQTVGVCVCVCVCVFWRLFRD